MENNITDISQIKDWTMPNLSSLNVASNKISNLQPLIQIDYSNIPKVKIVLGNKLIN